jgi:hypothetical protein
MGLLKIDFKNAFNMVDRGTFLHAVKVKFPRMAKWAYWCYEGPSTLLYDKTHIIYSESGVQQGDPLGPLLFCCALAPLVEKIQALGPAYNKWYMDDGGIIGSPELLQEVWDILRLEGPSIGCILNPSKCEWTWIDGSEDPCPLLSGSSPCGALMVQPDDVCMLGVPLGPLPSASKFVRENLFARLAPVLERLVEFDDIQAAFFLLRTSFSIVRATHFMRTTPLEVWPAEAAEFDTLLREAACKILGFPMNDQVFDQASLTPKLGGMGLRRILEHAEVAYIASRSEAASTCGREVWVPPPTASLPL